MQSSFKIVYFISTLTLLAAIFLFRWYATDPHCDTTAFGKANIQGYVSEMPDIRPDHMRLIVEADNGEKILVRTMRYPRYAYGDHIEISGERKSPRFQDNNSYTHYLESKGICSLFYQPRIQRFPENNANPFWAWIYKVKENFLEHLKKLFPEPQASFAAGLLLGDRKGLPEAITRDFRRAGVSHIIALSGYNITILFAFIIFLLQTVSRRVQFFVAIPLMLWFVLLTGAAPSIVRAGIMGFLWFFARIIGRPSSGLRALFLSAAIMLFINPRLLLFDPGFQLSFLATFGLMTLGKKIEQWFLWIPWKLIREPFIQTLSATIPTLPILIFYFGQISFVAPFSNVIILPLIPLAMLFSGIPLFLDYFSHTLASLAGWWGNLLLLFILKIAEWFASLPFSFLNF